MDIDVRTSCPTENAKVYRSLKTCDMSKKSRTEIILTQMFGINMKLFFVKVLHDLNPYLPMMPNDLHQFTSWHKKVWKIQQVIKKSHQKPNNPILRVFKILLDKSLTMFLVFSRAFPFVCFLNEVFGVQNLHLKDAAQNSKINETSLLGCKNCTCSIDMMQKWY